MMIKSPGVKKGLRPPLSEVTAPSIVTSDCAGWDWMSAPGATDKRMSSGKDGRSRSWAWMAGINDPKRWRSATISSIETIRKSCWLVAISRSHSKPPWNWSNFPAAARTRSSWFKKLTWASTWWFSNLCWMSGGRIFASNAICWCPIKWTGRDHSSEVTNCFHWAKSPSLVRNSSMWWIFLKRLNSIYPPPF